MDSSRGDHRPNIREAFRPDSLADRLQLRLFAVRFRTLTPQTWRFSELCNTYWRLYINDIDGAMLRIHEGKKSYLFPLSAGQLYFIPAGVVFDCVCSAPEVGHLYAHFDLIGLPGLLLRKLFDHPYPIYTTADLRQRAVTIGRELRQKDEDARESLSAFCRTKSLIYDALALSLDALTAADREQHYVRATLLEPVLPALEIMDKQFGEPLGNEILAEACSFSEDYFIRKFKECVGESPNAFLMRRRVETAAQRLLFTADSIERIAADCGFGNRFYFTRVFTRQTGVAPGAYRKAAQV